MRCKYLKGGRGKEGRREGQGEKQRDRVGVGGKEGDREEDNNKK